MFDFAASSRQVGLRQRSLRRHCRLGRATELVFVLATGATLVIGGQAGAQTIILTDNDGAITELTYWDDLGGGASAAPGQGGSGLWDRNGGNVVWSSEFYGPSAFYDGLDLVFAGAPGSVTISNSWGAPIADSMTVRSNGYVFSGGAVQIVDGLGIHGSGTTATFHNSFLGNLVIAPLHSYRASWMLADGYGTAVLTGSVQGSLTQQSAGTLRLVNASVGGDLITRSARTQIEGATSVLGTIRAIGGTTAFVAGTYTGSNLSFGGGTVEVTSTGGWNYNAAAMSVASGSTLDVKNGGTLSVSADLPGTIVNRGTVSVGSGSRLLSEGLINANVITTTGANNVQISGGQINGDFTLASQGATMGAVTVSGDVVLNGDLNLTGDVTFGGDVSQNSGAITNRASADGTQITITNNSGDNTFRHGGVLNGGAGTRSLNLALANYVSSGGSIQGTVTGLPETLLTITGGVTDVNADIATDILVEATGVMDVTGASTVGNPGNNVFDVENNGQVQVQSGQSLTASSFENNQTLSLLGTGSLALTVDGTDGTFADRNAFVNAGTVSFGAGAALTARDRVENEAGSSMTFAGDATITVDSDSDGTANAETFINDGTINLTGGAGKVTVTSPNAGVTMTNTANATLSVGTGWELDVSGMNAGSGAQDISNAGTLTMAGGSLTGNVLNAGTLNMNSGTVSGVVYNNSATGLTLSGGTITGGLGLQAGTTTVNVTGDARVNGQTTVGSGTLNVQTGNRLTANTLAGLTGTNINLDGTLDGRILLRNGTLNLAGDILSQVNTGNLETYLGFANSQINVTDDSRVQGLVDIWGGELDVASGVNFTIDNTMDIGSAAALDVNRGTITGSVNSAGSTDIAGAITGTYRQQDGTTTISGDSTIGKVDLDAGSMTVASSQTLDATNGITVGDGITTSTATLTINGQTTGDVTLNQDGVLNLNSGVAIDNAALVTANNGTVNVNSSEVVGGLSLGSLGKINLNGRAITVTGSGTETIAGTITGTSYSQFVRAGTGTTIVTSALSYSGDTTVTGGTLSLTGNGALTGSRYIHVFGGDVKTDGGAFGSSARVNLVSSDSALTMTGDESFRLLAGNVGSSVVLNNGARATLTGNASGLAFLRSNISGDGGLTFNNDPTYRFILTGTNTYGGETQVISGTLSVGGEAILDTGTVNVTGGTLQLDDDETIGALTGAGTGGTVQLGNNELTVAGTGTAGGTTFDGAIIGTGGLRVAGATADLTLSDDQSYTGATNVSLGSLTAQGQLATSGVSVSGGSFTLAATTDVIADVNSVTVSASGAATVTSGNVNNLTNNGSTDGATNVTIGGGVVTTLTQNSGDLSLTGGNITIFNQTGGTTTATGTVGLTNTSTVSGGTFTLDGSAFVTAYRGPSFTGTGVLNVVQGSLFGGPVSIGGTDVVTHKIGGGVHQGLVRSMTVTNANATVEVDRNGGMSTLTNQGGTVTVTGNGTTGLASFDTINNTSGTLNIHGETVISTDVTNGGQMNVADSFGNSDFAYTVNTTGTVTLSGANVQAGISQTAGLTDVQTNSTVRDVLAVSGGTLQVDDGATLTATGSVDLSGTAVLDASGMITGDVDITGTSVTHTIGGGTGTDGVSGTLTQNNALAVTTLTATDGAFGTSVGTLTNTAGTVIYTGDGSHVLVNASSNAGTLGIAAGTTVTASNGLTNTGTMNLGGTLAGTLTNQGATNITGGTAGAITQNAGAGTLTVDAGSNGTVTNAFNMSAGTLTLGNGATLTAGSFDLTGGTFALGAGSGFVGTGNTFNLGFALNAPTGFSITDTGAINVNTGGSFTFSSGGALTADSDNSGGESVNINNGGTLTVNGGALTVSSGGTGSAGTPPATLNVANGGTVEVTNATLTVQQNTNTTAQAGTIVSAGTLNLSGAVVNANLVQQALADTNVTGTSTINGTATLNGGTLTIASGQQLTSGLVTINGGTLDAQGTLASDVAFGGATGNVSGTIDGNISVLSGQVLTATGDLTYDAMSVQSGGTFTTTGSGGINILGVTNTTTIDGAAVYNGGDVVNDNGGFVIGYGAAGATVDFNTAGGAITFNADADHDNNGSILNGGTISVTGANGTVTMGSGTGDDAFLNASAATTGFENGQLSLGADTTVTGITTLTNESASATAISLASGALLDVVALSSTNGTITTAGEIDGNVTLSGTDSAALVVNAGGAVDGDLATTGNTTFDINGTTGDATVEVTGTLTQGSTGASTITGDVAGQVTVTSGTLAVDGASAFNGGLDLDGGAVNVNAALTASGTTTVDSATLTIANGGTLTGNVSAGATSGTGSVVVGDGTNTGSVSGTLNTTGGATFDINSDGSVTGLVTAGATGVTSELGGNIGGLNVTGTNIVNVNSNMTNSGLSFVDGGGTLNIQTGSTYNAAGGPVNVGFDAGNAGGTGTLTVANDANIAGTINVHNGGTVDINGTIGGLLTEVTGNLTLFSTATGTSTLSGDVGGSVAVNGGALTVDGASGVGNLLVGNGGTVNVNAATRVTGATTVDGAGTRLTVADGTVLTANGGLSVGGVVGGATLDLRGSVAGGGITATSGTVLLGDGSGTTSVAGTVQFDAGTLTMTGPVDIDGTLDINGGAASVATGTVTANDIDIAAAAGTVSVNGALVADTSTLANGAALNVAPGGTLDAATELTNTGTITYANGGALNAVTLENGGAIAVTSGAVTSNGAALNNTAGGTLAVNGGSLTGLGAINNTSTRPYAINIADNATLGFTTLTSSAGIITVGGGTAQLSGTSVALTGTADLDLNGGTITGTLDNQSGTQISLHGSVNGAFTQQGAAVETVVDGTGVIFGTTATVSAGKLNVIANIDAAGGLSMGAASALDVGNGVTINAGTMTLANGMTTVLGNNVTLSTDTGLLDNGATLGFGTGGSLTSAAALTNTGDVSFGTNGTMTSTGALSNALGMGSVTFNDGGTLSSGSGTITNAGHIIVNAGTVTTANSSIVADGMGTRTALSGGNLNLGTGTFTDANGTGNLTSLYVAGDASRTATFTAASITLSESEVILDSTFGAAQLDLGGGGTLTLNGTSQTSEVFGTINGLVDVNGGSLTIDGTSSITGAITVDGAGTGLVVGDGVTLTNAGGMTLDTGALLDMHGSLTGNLLNTNGTVQLGDATGTTVITGSLSQSGGATTIVGDTDVTAAMLIHNGDLTVNALTTLDLTNVSGTNTLNLATAGTFTNNGRVVGNVSFTGSGAANINGTFVNGYTQNNAAAVTTITGASDFQRGFVNTAGRINVNAPLTLGTDATNAGTLDINGNVLGGQTITNTGTATLSSASFTGSYTQDGGQTTIDGDTALLDTGPSTAAGVFTLNTGVLDVLAGTTLQAVTMDFNAGTSVRLYDGATLNGTGNTHMIGGIETMLGATANLVEATGDIILESTGSLLMRNDMQQTLNATLTTAGRSFTAEAGSIISMVDATTADTSDRIVINGDAVLNGTVQMDVNVSGATVGAVAAGTSDRITATGNVTGAATFQLQNVNATYAAIAAPMTLVESTGGSTAGLGATLSGLPIGGSYNYSLTNTGTQLQLLATPSLAYGGLVSGVAATESLLSATVDRRPSVSSASGLGADDGSCAADTWARVIGGRDKASLATTSPTTGLSATNNVNVSYGGIQMGVGNSCAGNSATGWDLAYGATLGTNTGKTILPVNLGFTATTVNSKFEQVFGGVYLNAANGNWSGNLNLRTSKTTHNLSESNAFGLGGLGLSNQKVDSHGNTVSGSVSYSYALSEDQNTRLVPTVGFMLSRIKTGSIAIENDPSTTADDGVLQIGDITQKIGYLGATLSRTNVQPGGDAAITYFATGTYFKDFGKNLNSTFTVTSSGAQQQMVSETLGGYGEVSFGMNYTKVMPDRGALSARRLDASIRADMRFSDRLDSWGLTAQIGVKF